MYILKIFFLKGYDVNAIDNGGWTPLSEAVSANKIKNIRLLLEKGAYVDCRSREFLVDEENEQIVIFYCLNILYINYILICSYFTSFKK